MALSERQAHLQSRIRDLYDFLERTQTKFEAGHEYTPALRRLRSVAWVLSEFVESLTAPDDESEPSRPYTDILYQGAYDSLADAVMHATETLRGLLNDTYVYGNVANLAEARSLLLDLLRSAINDIRNDIERHGGKYGLKDIDRTTALSVALAGEVAQEVLTDAAAVSQAKTAQQETAGDIAESELAKEFNAYAEEQDEMGYKWLIAAIVLIAATVSIALAVLRQSGQAFNWFSLASHLLIALPCLGGGAYCARESSRHRELAQWARRLAVQLKSVSAYTARLDDGPRMTLLAQFGTYVFGHHPLGKDDNQVQPIPPELWKALADVVRARGGVEA